MNIKPPPPTGNPDLDQWLDEVYEFLKYPHFHLVRFIPRSSVSDTSEGNLYYDSDTNELTLRDDDSWEGVTTSSI